MWNCYTTLWGAQDVCPASEQRGRDYFTCQYFPRRRRLSTSNHWNEIFDGLAYSKGAIVWKKLTQGSWTLKGKTLQERGKNSYLGAACAGIPEQNPLRKRFQDWLHLRFKTSCDSHSQQLTILYASLKSLQILFIFLLPTSKRLLLRLQLRQNVIKMHGIFLSPTIISTIPTPI